MKTRKRITPEERARKNKQAVIGIVFSLIVSSIFFIVYKSWIVLAGAFFVFLILWFVYLKVSKDLKESARIKKMEDVFPDFLQLMSSNLRAGMTIDKAMLLSSRKEFSPLDEEIMNAGKAIATGQTTESALLEMSKKIGSDKIYKTILLLKSGMSAGGDIAILLEETSISMRERDFVEKKAASNVLMYVIFIFLAVAIFSPALFSLSNILVETLTKLIGSIPSVNITSAPVNLPFTLSSVNVSVGFIKYFSIVFIITTDILASLVLGLVSKGEEKEGMKYLLPLLILGLGTFFAVRFFLSGFISELIA